jgi:hypothetical protein
MILSATCEMRKNIPMDGYMAVRGLNMLVLKDDDGSEINRHTGNVLWMGSGSPYPTPPGGPWETIYMPAHSKFGRCFYVKSSRESEIFIHFAREKSYGCLIINPTTLGELFMEDLIKNRVGLDVIIHEVIDNRTDADRAKNPIDYSKMKKWIG